MTPSTIFNKERASKVHFTEYLFTENSDEETKPPAEPQQPDVQEAE